MTIRYTSIGTLTIHPPSIIRQLPTSINKCVALLSSDEQCCTALITSAPAYQNTLIHSSFNHDLSYTQHAPQQACRNRQRNIIWFNPPFSMSVSTNIGRNFLSLIDKHFPLHHKLHKIFNRNTVKVSYSYMNNVKSIITKHNAHIAGKNKPQDKGIVSIALCQKQCMTKDIVYKVFRSNLDLILQLYY